MRIMREQRSQRKVQGVREGGRITDIDIPEESESRVFRCLIKFVCAILRTRSSSVE